MVGGMISSTLLTLVVIPAVYALWKEREVVSDARVTTSEWRESASPRPIA
jgi:hypothetical protein